MTLSESSPNITTSPRITPREIRRVMMIQNSGSVRISAVSPDHGIPIVNRSPAKWEKSFF
jgi:hypothetical protein